MSVATGVHGSLCTPGITVNTSINAAQFESMNNIEVPLTFKLLLVQHGPIPATLTAGLLPQHSVPASYSLDYFYPQSQYAAPNIDWHRSIGALSPCFWHHLRVLQRSEGREGRRPRSSAQNGDVMFALLRPLFLSFSLWRLPSPSPSPHSFAL